MIISKDFGVVNILDFGAKGDGITDDTIAARKAIEYLTSIGGGRLIIPANFTLTVRRLQMRSNVSLEGYGPTSVIKGHPDALYNQYNIIFIDDDVENAAVKNLKIDANGDARTAFTEPSDTEIDNPIRLEACRNVLIENVEIVNATKGFGMNLWSGYRAEEFHMLENIIVRGCTIHVPKDGFQGIAVVQGKNILLENNTIYNIEGGGGWGIVLESNMPILTETYNSIRNTLQDVTVRNNTVIGAGIAVLGQGLINNKNIKVVDNTIEIFGGEAAFQTFMIHDVIFERNNIIYDSPNEESRVFYINGRSIRIRNNKVHLKTDVLSGLFSYSGAGVIAEDAEGTSFLTSDGIHYEDNEFTTDNDSSCYWHMHIIDSGRHLIRNNKIPMYAYSYAMHLNRVEEVNIIDSHLRGYWGLYIDTENEDGTDINIQNTKFSANKNHIQNIDMLRVNNSYFNGLNDNDPVLNDLVAHNREVFWSRDNIVNGGLQNDFKTAPKSIYSDNIPDSGFWYIGDTVINSNPKPGSFIGWVCTDYGYGNNGIWSPNTEYFLGDRINNNGRLYECVREGVSSDDEDDIPMWSEDYIDGTVHWRHVGFMAEFKPYGFIGEAFAGEVETIKSDNPPTGGNWTTGDVVYNSASEVGSNAGWICIRDGIASNNEWEPGYWGAGHLITDGRNIFIANNTGFIAHGESEPAYPQNIGDKFITAPSIAIWQPNTQYFNGDIVLPTVDNGFYYYAWSDGVSGNIEPVWPTNNWNSIAEGDIDWEARGFIEFENIGLAAEFQPFGTVGYKENTVGVFKWIYNQEKNSLDLVIDNE